MGLTSLGNNGDLTVTIIEGDRALASTREKQRNKEREEVLSRLREERDEGLFREETLAIGAECADLIEIIGKGGHKDWLPETRARGLNTPNGSFLLWRMSLGTVIGAGSMQTHTSVGGRGLRDLEFKVLDGNLKEEAQKIVALSHERRELLGLTPPPSPRYWNVGNRKIRAILLFLEKPEDPDICHAEELVKAWKNRVCEFENRERNVR